MEGVGYQWWMDKHILMNHERKQPPKYYRHKTSGRAFVRIGGKLYYPKKYGAKAGRRENNRILAKFIVNGR